MPRVFTLLLVIACLASVSTLTDAAETKSNGNFMVKAAPFKHSDYVGIRINTRTGQGWLIKNGNWQIISETETVPAGSYDLQIVSSGHPEQAHWNAFRYSLDTGRTWRLISGKWQLMQTLAEE